MENMDAKLREYARLLVEVGLNLDKGQDLLISCPVDCAWFARMCASAAYDLGCREVSVLWRDDYLDRELYTRAADDVFDASSPWMKARFDELAESNVAYLIIKATNPENLKGVDPERLMRRQRADNIALEKFSNARMNNVVPWCIASIPVPSWAKKVFPNCSEEEAMDKLWEAILYTVRVSGDGNAAKRWKEHTDKLTERMNKLNEMRLESLHYTNSLGSDFVVRLPKNHLWAGGGSDSKAGRYFIANMPTEEIFTAPMKDGIDGVICAALPLVNNGNVIENLRFVVKDGKIVEAHSTTCEENLKAAISVDEGASHFGEVALVPYNSPISNLKLLFYNTLFDENASCHLAFGRAYAECVMGGQEMTKEQLAAEGLNDSLTHVDFMVGTADLNIMGHTQDGRDVPIFINGDFAI